jgi:hypothetical protein
MSPHSNLVVCAADLSLLVACDNPPKADDSNFEKALQSYYDSHPVCAAIPPTFLVDLRRTETPPGSSSWNRW